MKFLLIMHINPAIMEELTDAERQEIMDGPAHS
jgi:hypothetical protein